MHNGSFKTLEAILDFYNRGGGTAFTTIPNQTLSDQILGLNKQEKQAIIAFIKSLSDSSLNSIKAPKHLE